MREKIQECPILAPLFLRTGDPKEEGREKREEGREKRPQRLSYELLRHTDMFRPDIAPDDAEIPNISAHDFFSRVPDGCFNLLCSYMTDLEDYKSLNVVIHKNKQCKAHWDKSLRKYAHHAKPLFDVFTSKALLRWTLFEMHINARDWELRILIPKVDVDKGMKSLGQLCREGELDLVRAVLERTQARLDDRVRSDGATPLFFAASKGHLEVVRYLCEAGANKDAARDTGATPL